MQRLGSVGFLTANIATPRSSFSTRPLVLCSLPVRSLHVHCARPVTNIVNRRARRAYSVKTDATSGLFNYTSGRWIINDAIRMTERRRIFNVDELCRLAAESVGRSQGDIVEFAKLAEGKSNRIFLVTMRDGFQMVARIPYHTTVPKYYALASEVATMNFLRASGLPVPEVYGYSPVSDNAAETEYIFMEYIQGSKLSDIWDGMVEPEIISITRQIAQLESMMMSINFPAGGSLYHAKDLENVTVGAQGVPVDGGGFCIGPDTSSSLWYGRRSQLDVDRSPYESAEAALTRPAVKERTYLERFGEPLLPLQRMRREVYRYQKQQPYQHSDNIDHYLRIAPSLIPSNTSLHRFTLRHPNLTPSNIFISNSRDSDLPIISLLDWRQTSIQPTFLAAGIPQSFQNHGDPVSDALAVPSLPENLADLEKSQAKELYRRRLVHYHYVKNTDQFNKLHHEAIVDPAHSLRHRLFTQASSPWEGENLTLKMALIDATEPTNWAQLTSEAPGAPSCPVLFDAQDVADTRQLDTVQQGADFVLEAFQGLIGVGRDGEVAPERYEDVTKRANEVKEQMLEVCESDKERAEFLEHWAFGDMDEEKYR